MKSMKTLILGALLTLIVVASASATTLTSQLTVDNGYTLFLSTSPGTAGTTIGSANNWYNLNTFTTTLNANQAYYIHVDAYDQGGIAGFLGSFSLSDSGFKFANGTQNLLTNTNDWTSSTAGFGGVAATTIALGNNGVGPWGNFNAIPSSTQWIWANNADSVDRAYFSATITPSNPVPEPSTILLLGAGLAGLGILGRKARK